MTPLIQLVSVLVFPAAVLIAISHLLGAESGPGDGFTAGIILALAMALWFETHGYGESPLRSRPPRYDVVLCAGLTAVLAAALLPLALGEPLLAQAKLAIEAPLLGEIELSRSLLFDLGIGLAVFGGTMVAIDSLRRPDAGGEER